MFLPAIPPPDLLARLHTKWGNKPSSCVVHLYRPATTDFHPDYETTFIHDGKCQTELVCTEASRGSVELVWSGC